jgi:hypothetical protein
MDFIRIIRSLEEFLYEVMTWLVFYPRTLLRTALHPLRTLADTRKELDKAPDDQFSDSLSAPLFLMLTLLISHLFEMAVRLQPFADATHGAGKLLASDQNLVIVRSLIFAAFPLMYALEEVRRSDEPLNRKTLRGPFFSECYPAAVFALVFGIGGTLVAWPAGDSRIGYACMIAATLWYLAVQSTWLRQNGGSWPRAAFTAARCFLQAAALTIAVALALGLAF